MANKGDVLGLLGIEQINATDENGFALKYQVNEKHLNPFGTIHGGILYTLCDDCLMTFEQYNGKTGIGSEGIVHYYRAAVPGDVITARASIRKDGRRMGFYLIELFNEAGKLICDATYTVVYA